MLFFHLPSQRLCPKLPRRTGTHCFLTIIVILRQLDKINRVVMQARQWKEHKRGKQADFLLERAFPWHLIERIGVYSWIVYQRVANKLPTNGHRPPVEIIKSWYY